ncbi:MAG: hypothetical protein LBT43_01395 [Prevotella sp.]|jgi:hypothetical protein|nr:hypothetical protein [Prevotella sp.]
MIRNNGQINKGQILDRMCKLAANLFGISHTELLDPVVNLFLGSLSEEVYKVAGEIDNIENRILDKLSSILVPSIDTIAKPAHCILHAVPREGIAEVTCENEFRHFSKNRNRSFSFYPVCNTDIRKGGILYFIHKGGIYSLDRNLSKTLYIRSHRHEMDDNTFWLGLDLDKGIKDISGLSFYFDIHGISDKDRYLSLLPYTTWSIGDEILTMNKGISSQKQEYENITLSLFSGYDLSNKINRSVKEFYHNRYLSIAGNCPIEGKKEILPEELLPYFPENTVSGIEKPLVWIKVSCIRKMTADIISSLQPSINAFPVVNKELIFRTTDVKRMMPVIPLSTENKESFISINKVTDSSGKKYHDVPLYQDTDNSCGIYSLRRGGVEHYNRRDAEEYIAHITDALSWEVSAFFKDNDEVIAGLKKIEEQVNELIRQLKKRQAEIKDRYEIENYLFLPPLDKESEVYFIHYWITNGEQANHVRPGSIFSSVSDASETYSLTQTTGGKYAPRASEKENLYKESMTDHSLLITDDDILNFCLKEFSGSVSEVKVCGGFMDSDNPKLGFIETTDVYLKPLGSMKGYIKEKEKRYYLQMLEENSPATFNFRIFIN